MAATPPSPPFSVLPHRTNSYPGIAPGSPSQATVQVLILGAGWTSTFLIPLLEKKNITYAKTTRDGRNGSIKWEFDPTVDFKRLRKVKQRGGVEDPLDLRGLRRAIEAPAINGSPRGDDGSGQGENEGSPGHSPDLHEDEDISEDERDRRARERERLEIYNHFSVLPAARTVLITFPIMGPGGSEKLLRGYLDVHPQLKGWTRWIQLGSTGIWAVSRRLPFPKFIQYFCCYEEDQSGWCRILQAKGLQVLRGHNKTLTRL